MQKNLNYKDLLKREGLKNTKHRISILDEIETCEQPVSAEQIFLRLQDKHISINLSTVYRALETLVEKNIVIKSSITGDAKALFEPYQMEHKHHLVCVKCKKMFTVDGCPFEEYEKILHEKIGFDVKGHKLEIFGYCKDCK